MKTVDQPIELQPLHSFRLPAKAKDVFYLNSLEQLPKLNPGSLILGAGTNTIFLDDFTQPIVKVELKGVQLHEEKTHWLITVGAGENWHELICQLMARGIYGLENMALIPGTVGAAPVQNIGAYGREVADFIDLVQAWDLANKKLVVFTNEECAFGYRESIFKRQPGRWLIVGVVFKIAKQWQPEVSYGELSKLPRPVTPSQVFREVIAIRQRKLPDPSKIPNAGSFFKNPVIDKTQLSALLIKYPHMPYFELNDGRIKLAAGWLIDNLGLKGFRIGDAAVHEQQALVLVNTGAATSSELVQLAQHVSKSVKAAYEVELEPEVRLLGSEGLVVI